MSLKNELINQLKMKTMKKLSIAFVMIFGFSQFMVVQAQDIKFGAKAGLNLANMSGDVEDNSIKLGLHIGGMAEIKISETFAVQPELLYSAQGAKFSDGTLALNYLVLPVMAKFSVTENLTLEAGPQFGYLLSAKAKNNDMEEEDLPSISQKNSSSSKAQAASANSIDVKENFKSFDVGVAVGASYLLNNGMNLSIRYIMGLSNTPEFDDSDFKYKNAVFQFSVGYYF
jgi:hypothetical protein